MTLEEVRARLGEAAILLDFDGTLAPIVPKPEDARPLPEVAEVLAVLVERAKLVAVITGRPEPFIRRVLDVQKLEVVGLYGFDGARGLDPQVLAAVSALAEREPGARVEDKGVSVAVHVRGAPDPDAAAGRLRGQLNSLATLHDLAAFEGKRVIELGPRGARKSAAVRQLVSRVEPGAALYAGDDLEDLEAFKALGELDVPIARIAVVTSETPEGLPAAADVTVEGPAGLVFLLSEL